MLGCVGVVQGCLGHTPRHSREQMGVLLRPQTGPTSRVNYSCLLTQLFPFRVFKYLIISSYNIDAVLLATVGLSGRLWAGGVPSRLPSALWPLPGGSLVTAGQGLTG